MGYISFSGGSRIFMMGGDSERLGALHWRGLGAIIIIKRSISLFFSLSAGKNRKCFFGLGAIAPSAPPKSATDFFADFPHQK
jgi:hypothetical protein